MSGWRGSQSRKGSIKHVIPSVERVYLIGWSRTVTIAQQSVQTILSVVLHGMRYTRSALGMTVVYSKLFRLRWSRAILYAKTRRMAIINCYLFIIN